MALWHKVVASGIDQVVENSAVRQLLAQWTAEHERTGQTPLAADWSLQRLHEQLPTLMLLRAEGDDFRYLHYGTAISRHSGFDMTGRLVSEFGGEVGDFFLARYREVQASGAPLYTVHYSDRAKSVFTWERLILPLHGEDDADRLLVYNQPLESRHQLLESVLNATNDGILALRAVSRADGAIDDWLVTVANQRFCVLAGCAAAGAAGHSVREVLPAWETSGLGPHCEAAMHSRGGSSFELSLTTGEGERDFDVRAGPMEDGCVLVLTDITERKRAEQQRSELEAKLRESQRLEAIGTLAGGIAHDFNNVLGAILGNVAMLQADFGAQAGVRGPLDQVQRSALRARSLVQQLLAFSRREAPEFEVQALAPVIDETLTMMRSMLPAGVELRRQVSGEPVHALADANQLHQALLNLATNAWQALPATGGWISLGLDIAERASIAHAHLWVADNGHGMEPALRARIFEPFFTSKPLGQSSGLGLSVVHGIVNAHGGSINVTTAPGQGTQIDVWLPLATLTSQAPAPPAAVPRPQEGRVRHVLFIDDDEVIGLTVQALLQRGGLRATFVSDAAAALEQLRANPQAVDLVLTDYNMPQLSGLDVARAVALIDGRLPVVICSGYVTDALEREALALGVRRVLHKEHLSEELVPVLSRLLDETEVRPL